MSSQNHESGSDGIINSDAKKGCINRVASLIPSLPTQLGSATSGHLARRREGQNHRGAKLKEPGALATALVVGKVQVFVPRAKLAKHFAASPLVGRRRRVIRQISAVANAPVP
jgi:hypothetical protein